MSRNNLKRYLMLLAVIGLLAVGMGGSGTFASFNAEVSNTGNYFQSGTLLLHDNGGTTTCASESASNNLNNSSNNCDVLFNFPVSLASATLTTALVSGNAVTSLAVTAIAGIAVQTGDSIIVTSGANTQTFVASAPAALGATSISVTSQNANFSYPIGSLVTGDTSTRYATLKLTNAGTLDASDIKFDTPSNCTDSTGSTVNATLPGSLSAGAQTTITTSAIAIALRTGDVITITQGANTDTVTAAANANVGATSINVTGSTTVNSYTSGATFSWGPTFGAGTLCSQLQFVIIETDTSYNHNSANHALGCAYGTADINNGTDGLGCTFAGGTNLSTIGNTLTALSLVSGANSNTGVQLNASQSRYFVIGVRASSLANTYQNKLASFDLRWHIDQA
ncbi:MAG TPA: hypothetical protein VNC40_08340 [Gaiellaceae bacterium]|nr:hypothetical protein [Gaiellaceae bacterium]